MGVGLGLKGHSTQNSTGSGRAERPYGWMLLLSIAFGALLFGVMALHRHKEKRVIDLVIKDKDLQLHSLHLQLQKERDFGKEANRKSEELKSELYALQNQKSELSGKIREMQSTISSLKEEHKAIESALEEKQNEVYLMKDREKRVNEQNSRSSFLSEVLNLKEAEFEDLKTNLKLPVGDWDINVRYPNSPVKLTTRVGAKRDDTVSTNKENGGTLHNYIKTAHGNSTNGEDVRETGNVAVSRKISEEPSHILKSSQEGFQNKNTTNENHGKQMNYEISKGSKALDIDTKKSNTNGTKASPNSVDFEKPKDGDGATLAANTKLEANSVVFRNPKDVDGATVAANTKFRNNGQEKNVGGGTREKIFFRNERDGKQKERPEEAEILKLKEKGQSLGLDIRTASDENVAKFKSFKPVLWKESKELKGDNKVGSESKTKKDHLSSVLKSNMNSENRISKKNLQWADEVEVNKNINGKRDDKKKKPRGIVHQEAQANGNSHRTESSANDKAANPKKRYIANKNADIANLEVADTYE